MSVVSVATWLKPLVRGMASNVRVMSACPERRLRPWLDGRSHQCLSSSVRGARLLLGSRRVVVSLDELLEANHLLGGVVLQPAPKERFGEPTPRSLEAEHLPVRDHGAFIGLFGVERALEVEEPPSRTRDRRPERQTRVGSGERVGARRAGQSSDAAGELSRPAIAF